MLKTLDGVIPPEKNQGNKTKGELTVFAAGTLKPEKS